MILLFAIFNSLLVVVASVFCCRYSLFRVSSDVKLVHALSFCRVFLVLQSMFLLQDIRNQRRYRQRRRQEKKKLGQTLDSLQSKSQFYEEQIDYYNQYIRVCLDNLSKKGK